MQKHLLSLLLLAGALVPSFSFTAEAGEETPASLTQAFYEKYAKAPDDDIQLSRFPELDKAYIDKIDAMNRQAAKEDPELGGLDFDPVVWGQEVPEKFVILSQSMGNEAALITVGKTWPGEKAPSSQICVSLRKKSGTWKIIDTVDPDLFDLKDCSSFRPGEMFPPIF